MWPHYFPFMRRLNRVFAAMQLSLCSSCFRERHRNIADEHPILLGRGGGLQTNAFHHHSGHNQTLLDASSPVSHEAMQRWFQDREHGLFHGLCTAIMGGMAALDDLTTTSAMLQQFEQKDPWASRYFTSAVLHDFCRGSEGKEQGHDADLLKYFPGLLPETYEHSTPSQKYETSPLVFGDRLELQRFDDHKTWVDAEKMEQPRRACNPHFADIFYSCVRPALEMLFFQENEVWIRHGLENRADGIQLPDYNWSKKYYPQIGSYCNVRDRAKEEGFSVEISRGGLSQCVLHGAQWVHVQGIIPAKNFVEHGGAIRRCDTEAVPYQTFDHMCGVGNAPLDSWVFHYHEPLDDPEAVGMYKSNPYRDCLRPLFENGALLIPSDLANNWRNLVDQWRVRLELMCVYSREGS